MLHICVCILIFKNKDISYINDTSIKENKDISDTFLDGHIVTDTNMQPQCPCSIYVYDTGSTRGRALSLTSLNGRGSGVGRSHIFKSLYPISDGTNVSLW